MCWPVLIAVLISWYTCIYIWHMRHGTFNLFNRKELYIMAVHTYISAKPPNRVQLRTLENNLARKS